jgi:hypothetical protein
MYFRLRDKKLVPARELLFLRTPREVPIGREKRSPSLKSMKCGNVDQDCDDVIDATNTLKCNCHYTRRCWIFDGAVKDQSCSVLAPKL